MCASVLELKHIVGFFNCIVWFYSLVVSSRDN